MSDAALNCGGSSEPEDLMEALDRSLSDVRIAPMTRDEATCIVRSIFRRCGYAIGEHGTRGRDLDLMAMPWNDRAGIPALIVKEVVEALEARVCNGPETKPHGRLAWSIHPRRTARHDLWYVDLSVIVPEEYR